MAVVPKVMGCDAPLGAKIGPFLLKGSGPVMCVPIVPHQSWKLQVHSNQNTEQFGIQGGLQRGLPDPAQGQLDAPKPLGACGATTLPLQVFTLAPEVQAELWEPFFYENAFLRQ